MTGIDEHIRTLNRLVAQCEGHDLREKARTALHHIAAREQKQRERITELMQTLEMQSELRDYVKELEARNARLEVACGSLDTHEALTARVQELERHNYDLQSLWNSSQAENERLRKRVKQYEDELAAPVSRERQRADHIRDLYDEKVAEVQRLRETLEAIIYADDVESAAVHARRALTEWVQREEVNFHGGEYPEHADLIEENERLREALREIAGGPDMQRRTSLQAIARQALDNE